MEAVGERDVIGVHAGDEAPFSLGEAKIEGMGDLEISFVFEDTETGVDPGVVFENLVGRVG